jgi:hypothetical protein
MRKIPEIVKERPYQDKLFYVPEKVICSCGWFVNIIQKDTVTAKVIVVECMNMQCSQFEVEKKIPMPEMFWE